MRLIDEKVNDAQREKLFCYVERQITSRLGFSTMHGTNQ